MRFGHYLVEDTNSTCSLAKNEKTKDELLESQMFFTVGVRSRKIMSQETSVMEKFSQFLSLRSNCQPQKTDKKEHYRAPRQTLSQGGLLELASFLRFSFCFTANTFSCWLDKNPRNVSVRLAIGRYRYFASCWKMHLSLCAEEQQDAKCLVSPK